MSHPFKDIADILSTLTESQLLDEIDVSDIDVEDIDADDFDVDISTDVRNIKDNASSSRAGTPRRRGRSGRGRRNKDKERSGKKKFETKRKIKKINRKMKEAERKGLDMTDAFENTDDKIMCTWDHLDESTLEIVVDSPDAEVIFVPLRKTTEERYIARVIIPEGDIESRPIDIKSDIQHINTKFSDPVISETTTNNNQVKTITIIDSEEDVDVDFHDI